MKRVLITGANSYIGVSVEQWLKQWENEYEVDTLDMQSAEWKKYDFFKYDCVFHVAGIAHADVGNVSEETKQLYYKVNTELTEMVAKKAKNTGVKQFIFMSSIIVYGDNQSVRKKRIITRDTPLSPANFYGDSKAKAEERLQNLIDERFKVVILRPPMIYGKNSKGNYPVLAKMARKLPIFPRFSNERSMLHIDNLCEFIKFMIDNEESGVFMPQNREYVSTSEMVDVIAKAHEKKIVILSGFGWLVKLLSFAPGKVGKLVNKAFGNLIYDKELSEYDKGNYQIREFEESILLTERGK